MAKMQPMSFRPSRRFDLRLSALARRTGRSKAFLLESLADEAERCRRYPGLAFRGPDNRRRAWVVSTGMDIWEVIWAIREGDHTAPAIAAPVAQLAKAYHREFPEEVDAFLDEMRRSPDDLAADYPFARHLIIQHSG